jgi:hypothetical protein
MAAGLGFKDFTTGEVLTAADVDGYLMQGVWVFASATARDAAVTSPQEGNFAYLKDTNVTTYYTGSAWANLDTTGMTNPMTTTGDTIYSSSGSTPARLGIGSTGNVLTVAGGVPVWAAPASGGGMTLINTGGTTLTGASVTISSIPSGYNYLSLFVSDFKPATDATALNMRFNSDSGNNYIQESGSGNNSAINDTKLLLSGDADNTSANGFIVADIFNYLSTTAWRITRINSWVNNATTPANGNWTARTGVYGAVGSAITSVTLLPASGNFTSGTAYLYGVK